MYLVVPPGGCFPETRRIELGPGALTIGRAEVCEIRVDVPGVDEEHAKISEVALVALGPDCAVGDVPLEAGSRRLLMPGDEIQIGSVVVAVDGEDPGEALPATVDLDSDERNARAARMQCPRVRVVEGSNFGDELLLTDDGREYVVGRGPSCDLVLEDREVSREHVKLMRRGFAVHIRDLSSTRGSWLGRAAVYTGASAEWSRPRMLRVGATVLSLDLPEAVRRAAPAAQASAPMTPPPRSRNGSPAGAGGGFQPRGSNALTPAPSQPPPGSPEAMNADAADVSTRRLGALDAPAAALIAGHSLPRPEVSTPHFGGHPPAPAPRSTRTAWKNSGPTIGKTSGLLLLGLAGLVILGGLFVVFSLLE